jgi:MoxR-like ATPase
VLTRRVARRAEAADVGAVVDAATLRRMQAGVEQVDVDPDVVAYCVALAAATRTHSAVEVGASPRGSLGLLLVSRALAVLDGRGVVLPEDVKQVAPSVLAHRLSLGVQTWNGTVTTASVVADVLRTTPAPTTLPTLGRRG